MLCHRKDTTRAPLNEECASKKQDLAHAHLPSRKSRWRSVALVGGLALGPHALCILGAGAASLGFGSAVFHAWCGEQGSEADSSRGITLKRPTSLPEKFTEFSSDRATRAAEELFRSEPRFRDIVAAKSLAAGGGDIRTVFIEDTNRVVSVVFCLNGSLCPCSVPQIYEVGLREDIAIKERFPGQREVLMALYGDESR